jgi:F0F1-type ATP synthase delta subunit
MISPTPVTADLLADRLLEYLNEQDLLAILPDLAERLTMEANHRYEVTVISSVALDPDTRAEIVPSLIERFGDHPITYAVDPGMVSGIIARFRDRVIDLSGQRQLIDLASHLKTNA